MYMLTVSKVSDPETRTPGNHPTVRLYAMVLQFEKVRLGRQSIMSTFIYHPELPIAVRQAGDMYIML